MTVGRLSLQECTKKLAQEGIPVKDPDEFSERQKAMLVGH
jgi:hypothetical protein